MILLHVHKPLHIQATYTNAQYVIDPQGKNWFRDRQSLMTMIMMMTTHRCQQNASAINAKKKRKPDISTFNKW